ncbi:hypothetical protein TW95_gp0376 [Pandoravirus inopinatum]|uniref:Uncharacterized protein n=1 Tax=Pandoravirus inopinatum TaxID=1605721 RepID=A0A0B5J5Y2_9VIRU|nr:hypothetical protein TW95_gp0376 [Pandoravirus inopinatum]AJF97110.1 hypothetical protein [Pandoravirus inopinatum]
MPVSGGRVAHLAVPVAPLFECILETVEVSTGGCSDTRGSAPHVTRVVRVSQAQKVSCGGGRPAPRRRVAKVDARYTGRFFGRAGIGEDAAPPAVDDARSQTGYSTGQERKYQNQQFVRQVVYAGHVGGRAAVCVYLVLLCFFESTTRPALSPFRSLFSASNDFFPPPTILFNRIMGRTQVCPEAASKFFYHLVASFLFFFFLFEWTATIVGSKARDGATILFLSAGALTGRSRANSNKHNGVPTKRKWHARRRAVFT